MLKKYMCIIAAAALLLGYGRAMADELPVDVSGIRAGAVIEQSSGLVVFEYNGTEKMNTGGLARLPVLLAVCNKIDSGAVNMSDIFTVSAAAARVGGPTAFLEEYEKIQVSVLLKAAVMICAGDAIYALAEGTYGSAETCIMEVNGLMTSMGIDVEYTDLASDKVQFTAHDMARIGAALMKSESFRLYSGLFYDSIQHEDGRSTELASSNKLLKSCTGTNGVGTGSSSEAGYCGVFSVQRGDTEYICVVFGAQNSSRRAEKAQNMLEYAFAAYDVRTLAEKGDVIRENASVHNGVKSSVSLVAREHVVTLIPKNSTLKESTEIPDVLEAPVEKNTVVGRVIYTLDGETVGVVELVSGEEIERANVADYIRKSLTEWLHS